MWEAVLLFSGEENIAFPGHIKWITKHSGSGQIGAAKDTRSQVLAAVNHSGPNPSFPARTSWYTSSADKIPSFIQCLPVGCAFYSFLVFIQVLIDLYSLSRENLTRTAVVVIPNTLWWSAPMYYHLRRGTNTVLMRTATNNPFPNNCRCWLIDVHPTGSDKTFLKCFTSFHCNSTICSSILDDM